MKFLPQLTVVLLFSISALSQTDAEFSYAVPNYKYFQFENGFELIAVENHTNPIIASVVVIRTGLRNETSENNGVSHMLEHMTFNGTKNRTQEQLYDEIDYHGIYLNAQTSEDYTTFMALNHKDQVDYALDILSDMLFQSTFPEEKFEKEKGIITEEIRKDSENPDFIKDVERRKVFYKDLPYSLPVIGTIRSVKNMSREQVTEYYQMYYRPHNMITIVTGDFEIEKIKEKFGRYFGNASSSKIPYRQTELQQTFPFLYEEENEKDRIITVILPAPTFHSDKYIPFQFFYTYAFNSQNGSIIDSLRSDESLLIKRIEPGYDIHPEFAILTLKITVDKKVSSQLIKDAVIRQIRQLKNYELTDSEINAIKQSEAISEILLTEKILYYGFLKSQSLSIGGKAAFEKVIPAILNASKTSINNIFKTYSDLWTTPEKLFQKNDWTDKIETSDYQSNFARTEKVSTQIYQKEFKNGLKTIHLRNTDNSVLAMHFLFKNRSAWEPAGKTGIADFLHHSLFKASKNYPSGRLAAELKHIGAEIKAYDWDYIPYDDYYNVPQYSYIRFLTLDQFFEKAVQMVADNILYPDLESNFPQVKKQMINLAKRSQSDSRKMARINFLKTLFSDTHPLVKPVHGNPQTIQSIHLEDLEIFHKEYYSANNTILTIVSSLDSHTVFSAIEKYFEKMPYHSDEKDIQAIPLKVTKISDSTKIGSHQSYIYLGYAIDANKSEELPLRIMNEMLSKKIAFSLREEQGLAYRLGTNINIWKDRYYFYATIGTGRENINRAIYGILDEMKQFKSSEISAQNLVQIKNSMQGALVRRRASRESQAFHLGINDFYNYPTSYIFDIYQEIKDVTRDEVLEVRNKYLQTDSYQLFYTIPEENSEDKTKKMMMPPGMRR